MTASENKLPSYRAVFPQAYEVVLEEQLLPDYLQPNEILIKNSYTLISPGTELAIFTRSHFGFSMPTHSFARYPFYPGYAAVGTVEKVGSAIDTVMPDALVYHMGGHASHAVLDCNRHVVLPVPADIPAQKVPFARFAQIANTACLVSNLQRGHTVLVIGLGIIGLLSAQLFALNGAQVIGSDPLELRRTLARQSGVPLVVDASADHLLTLIQTQTDGAGVDIVVESTGNAALIGSSLEYVRTRGEMILLGSPRGSAELDVYNHIHRRGITLKGAHEALFPLLPDGNGQMDRRSSARQMLQLLADGQLSVDHLISKIITPAHLAQAYDELHNHKDTTVSVLVDWRAYS